MSTRTKKSAQATGVLEVGYHVALSLKEGAAPLRSYIGEIQAVDATGIRVTLMDFFVGRAAGFDLFVPWSQLTAALVFTSEHNSENWIGAGRRPGEAGQWQEDMNRKDPQYVADRADEGQKPTKELTQGALVALGINVGKGKGPSIREVDLVERSLNRLDWKRVAKIVGATELRFSVVNAALGSLLKSGHVEVKQVTSNGRPYPAYRLTDKSPFATGKTS